jgi:alpha-D-ribose 1-methylphosphonate 5-triphosphate synthase subunit PhnL
MTLVLEVADVSKSFTMHLRAGLTLPVVKGVSFAARAGECVVLSGPSGAGKSSILKMIFGNYRCDGGAIRVHHGDRCTDIATASPRELLALRRSTWRPSRFWPAASRATLRCNAPGISSHA